MRIVSLAAENIKRLKAVSIEPDGNLVVVGGRNAQGKSSVLDAIAMAIGGKDLVPEKPVRTGAEKAFTEVDLGAYTVRRTLTAGGGTSLAVKAKDGSPIKSPQALLDSLVGALAFDPLAFARAKAKEQEEILRRIVRLDTSDLDAERQRLFDERTVINRTLKGLEAQVAGVQLVDGVPDAEVSIVDLVAQSEAADVAFAEADRLKKAFDEVTAKWKAGRERVEKIDGQILELEAQIEALRQEKAALMDRGADLRPQVVTAKDAYNAAVAALPDRPAIRRQMLDAEQVNAAVRENARVRALQAELDGAKLETARLSDAIDAIDQQKRERIAGAPYPVPGLQFDESGGILFNGEPFAQASSAERLRVSVAIGMALSPTLRVMLVREGGNDLDSDGLRLLAELAAQHDAQVWLERVAESKEGVTVLIEDGEVADVRPKPQMDDAGPKPAKKAIKRAFRNTSERNGFVDFEGDHGRLIVPAGETKPYPFSHAVSKMAPGIEEVAL